MSFASHASTPSNIPGYGTSAIVAMDRSASIASGTSLTSGLLLSQAKSMGKGGERSLESVLHSSKQKVTAIESMLRGLDISGKSRSSSLDLGIYLYLLLLCFLKNNLSFICCYLKLVLFGLDSDFLFILQEL